MRVRVRVYPEEARAEDRNIARPPRLCAFPRINGNPFHTVSTRVERERETE